MAEVRVEDTCKTFGRCVNALCSVSAIFKDGEFTVLVGPSGCGKTTLLRSIAGLEELTGGSIYIDDERVNDIPSWERDVAMVFQSYALYPHMTVFKNIAFPLKAQKVPKQEMARRVQETAEILQLQELLGRKPRELSGGQMQRVALGRAIVRNSGVFLMDEPLSNLDAKLRILMRAELKHLQKQLGVTTIYVTHDQAEAMTLADKLIVMNHGCIQQEGTSAEVYAHPANVFVAGFIGSPPMNFVNCNFDPNRNALVAPGFEYSISTQLKGKLASHLTDPLILGIRPENVAVQNEVSPNSVRALVYAKEPLGREMLLTLKIEETFINAFVPMSFQTDTGQDVWLAFNEDSIHIFDQTTEVAILT